MVKFKASQKYSSLLEGTSSELERKLGYKFVDQALLLEALTHSSHPKGFCNNQRLEFLGDSVLNLVIAELVFSELPGSKEGLLTRARSKLINSSTLYKVSEELDLGKLLRIHPSFQRSTSNSTYGDAVEALIGAAYLDGGFQVAERVVVHLFKKHVSKTHLLEADPKTKLQELCQSVKLALPSYTVIRVSGLPPKEIFEVKCIVNIANSNSESLGRGRSRRLAEQQAAHGMLKILSFQRGSTNAA